ncbi:hypothetical protein, partial [Dialister hominis]|uniref:hypothetical protein n=1 Tax=Dialister hominis TaxID=2582419 RepID=UPI003FEFE1D7
PYTRRSFFFGSRKGSLMNSLTFLTIFLGVMSAMAPLSTDMYLPSLPELSSYFFHFHIDDADDFDDDDDRHGAGADFWRAGQ